MRIRPSPEEIDWIWMKSIVQNVLLPSAHFEEALNKPLYHMGHSHTVGLVKELNYSNDWMNIDRQELQTL